MVSVTGKPGALKPTPVPQMVADCAPSASPRTSHLLASKAELRRALASPPQASSEAGTAGGGDGIGNGKGSEPLTFESTFRVRFSDEDVNKHANHTFLVRLVEDTLACARATRGKVGKNVNINVDVIIEYRSRI